MFHALLSSKHISINCNNSICMFIILLYLCWMGSETLDQRAREWLEGVMNKKTAIKSDRPVIERAIVMIEYWLFIIIDKRRLCSCEMQCLRTSECCVIIMKVCNYVLIGWMWPLVTFRLICFGITVHCGLFPSEVSDRFKLCVAASDGTIKMEAIWPLFNSLNEEGNDAVLYSSLHRFRRDIPGTLKAYTIY